MSYEYVMNTQYIFSVECVLCIPLCKKATQQRTNEEEKKSDSPTFI